MKVCKSIVPVLLAASALVTGCSWSGSVFNDKVDYQAARTRTVPLEIPPDLSQLPRDERFTVPERPQSVTASAATAARPGAPAGATRTWSTPTSRYRHRRSSRCAGRRAGKRSGRHGRTGRSARQN